MTRHFPAALVLAFGLGVALPAAHAQDAQSLRARHVAMSAELANSPFDRALLLESNSSSSDPQGHVYAVVAHPFAKVHAALQRPADWCSVLILQFNIKRCEPAGSDLRVTIGRKFEQAAEDAYEVVFSTTVHAAEADYLAVQMAAATGPLGTRNYRLELEAVAIDTQRTFVHMSYAYSAGMAARLATEAYLATSGRSKVGFSNLGGGKLVTGIRGVAERNTMRYYLAIEAVLDTLSVPAGQRLEARLQKWFSATTRYPRQLHEMELDQYLAAKRKEARPVASSG